jgi:hypothetical protein
MTEQDEAQARFRAAMLKLTNDLTEQGLLIEAGWLSCRAASLPRDASAKVLDLGRMFFFAGAHHVFNSVMFAFDDGDVATDADMNRLDKVKDELDRFIEKWAKEHGVNLR